MAKKYKGSFGYSTTNDSYDVKMKSGLPWWVWLIIGIVALFIASLFIRWDRTITVRVVDDMNAPIENAEVAVSYTARYCPWLTDDIALRGKTNAKGEVVISGVKTSVWNYLFYHNEPVEFKAEKDGDTGSQTAPLHTKEVVVIKLPRHRAPLAQVSFDVRTIDSFNGQPIPGAQLLVNVNGDGRPGTITTDANGHATISGVTDRDIVDVFARHPDYYPNDTTINRVKVLELRGNTTDIPMQPKVKCDQLVSHNTGNPHERIENIDLGEADKDFRFQYDTNTRPDQIRVFDENGQLLFDSQYVATCVARYVTLHSNTRYITVVVDNYDSPTGTVWNFMVDCP